MITNTTINGKVRTDPANGYPHTMLEVVEHEALAYCSWNTSIGDIVAPRWNVLLSLLAGLASVRKPSMKLAWKFGTRPSARNHSSAAWSRRVS
jgi:hypothetical protein